MDSTNKASDDENDNFILHSSQNVQTSNRKEPEIDLSSLEQESDESDLAMDQSVKDLADNQTNQANQTKKKFALRHPINLSRQRVQSHGRFEIVSPCKEISKKATPWAS